jgi:hypothetical protein
VVGCSVDERTLITGHVPLGMSGDGSSSAGGPSGQPEGGAAGDSGEVPLPRCNYAGGTLETGCESLVQNAGFAANVAGWTAEDLGVMEGWHDTDASETTGSGSLVVMNLNFKKEKEAQAGIAGGGARQCIPASSGKVYDLAADVFVPMGQGAGFEGEYMSAAGLSVFFYSEPGCASQTLSNFTSEQVSTPETWVHLEGSTKAPLETKSMAVRLATLKPFRQYTFEARFDNVFVRERAAP